MVDDDHVDVEPVGAGRKVYINIYLCIHKYLFMLSHKQHSKKFFFFFLSAEYKGGAKTAPKDGCGDKTNPKGPKRGAVCLCSSKIGARTFKFGFQNDLNFAESLQFHKSMHKYILALNLNPICLYLP